MRNKLLRQKIAFASMAPVLLPGMIFYALVHGYYAKAVVGVFALIFGVFSFVKFYKCFERARGFFKSFTLCFVLMNVSLVVLTFAPEANNAFAGAVLFLFLPSLILSVNLLVGNKITSTVAMFSKKGL